MPKSEEKKKHGLKQSTELHKQSLYMEQESKKISQKRNKGMKHLLIPLS